MKHPALTSALSVFLAVLCLVQLFAGIYGFKSADEDREENIIKYTRIENRLEKYLNVKEELDSSNLDYDAASESLVSREEQHRSDSSDHRTALSIYTATRSGELQGADALWTAKAAMPEAWRQIELAEAAYNEQAEQFNTQYEQYMRMKPILDAVMPLLDTILENSSAAREVIANLVEYEEVSDEQYEAANNAYKTVIELIVSFEESEYYTPIVERAAEAGIDLEAIFADLKSHSDESGDLVRDDVNNLRQETSEAIMNGFDSAISGIEQIKMIRENEDALIAGKEAIEMAGQAIAEGRKQLEQGEQMIQSSLEMLWYELGKLDDQKIDLEEERVKLLKENEEINALRAEVEYYEDLTKRVKGARNFLLYYSPVQEKYDEGYELVEAAQLAIDEAKTYTEHEYQVRRVFCYAAIAAAVFGLLTVLGAFEIIKLKNFVFVMSLICAAMSLGAEAYFRTLDIDSIYVTLITSIFAVLLALTVIPQRKKKQI